MSSTPEQAAFSTDDSVRRFVIEASGLLAISAFVIGLRTFLRIQQVGVKHLQADDYLMLLVLPPFATEIALAYIGGHRFRGLVNSGMTDQQRASLIPGSEEFVNRCEKHGQRIKGAVGVVELIRG